jgi:predicted phosphodiesterase
MTRYALIADIHANLEALRSVLTDIQEQQCSHIACLGDIVGCNDNPKECLDLIRGAGIPSIKGDYDEYCSNAAPLDGFNREAAAHIQWTRNQLSEADRQWLHQLPYQLELEDFVLVHTSLDRPQRWACVLETAAAGYHFANQKARVCFFAHTHNPVVYIKKDNVCELSYTEFKVEPEVKYLVNVGSVGQTEPQTRTDMAIYAIYDLEKQVIRLRSVNYAKPALPRPEPEALAPEPAALRIPIRTVQPVSTPQLPGAA